MSPHTPASNPTALPLSLQAAENTHQEEMFERAIARLQALKQYQALLDRTHSLVHPSTDQPAPMLSSDPFYREFIQQCHTIYQACPQPPHYVIS